MISEAVSWLASYGANPVDAYVGYSTPKILEHIFNSPSVF